MAQTPVSLVKSGKTYRQLFDAEVQLMKTLGENRTRQKELKVLPEIGKSLEGDSQIGGGGLTAPSILTNRQSEWKDGAFNDFQTENPVVNRQKGTELQMEEKEKRKKREANQVRGLPEVVNENMEERKSDKSIIHRINSACQKRYDKHLCAMYNEMSNIRATINPQVEKFGTTLMQSLQEVDVKIKNIFQQLSNDEHIFQIALSDFARIWKEVEVLFDAKIQLVRQTLDKFNQLEDDRIQMITKVLLKYGNRLKEVAAIPIVETRRLMEKEAMLLNQTSLANRKAYGELKRNMSEQVVKEEMDSRRYYDQRIDDWKEMKKRHIIADFINFMNQDNIKDPPEIFELNQEFVKDQTKVLSFRGSVMNQLASFQPPVSTKPSVYKWNTTLTKAQKNLEVLHKKWIDNLQMTYEKVCQKCLEKVEESKASLQHVSDDATKIVNEEFLTRVGNQLKLFERQLHRMERQIEQSARTNERHLRQLFKFAQSVAHLWDVHEINMARKDKEVETELEQSRLIYDKTNEERESRLDVLLDRLRQENSVENLNSCQNLCLHLLSEIKGSYYDFCEEQREKCEILPRLVDDELSRYETAVCGFFNVAKKPPEAPNTDESETGSEVDDVGDEPEAMKDDIREKLNEIVKTPGGFVYYLVGDDVIENEGSDADDDDVINELAEEQFASPRSKEYLGDVPITLEVVRDLKRSIRQNFLQHLDELQLQSMMAADEKVNYKKEELKCELELRLHLHRPRSERIQKDIRNAREVELNTHEDRIDRHCKGVVSTIASLKSTLAKLSEYGNQEIGSFKKELATIEEQISNTNQVVVIERKIEKAKEMEERFIAKLKNEGKIVKDKVNQKLCLLKKSNKLCLSSFKLFSDGGNFSPDEVAVLRKNVDVEIRKVEQFDAAFKSDFDSNLDKKCDLIHDAKNKFAERMKFQLSDVRFVELLQRWFLSAQVDIKSEVAHSNKMMQDIRDDVTLLIARIDACEYSHVDKEKITAEDLWKYGQELIKKLNDRCNYLDCRREPIPKKDPSDYELAASKKPSEIAASEMEEKDKNVISIIKNIHKKQGENVTASDIAIATTVKQVRKVYNENPPVEVVQSAGGKNKSGGGQQAPNAGGGKRDGKMDARFYPFGFEPPQKEHFFAKISAILHRVLENLYTVCDNYYKHKGFRPNTRPNYIQDNLENCCESVLEKTLKYYDQCQKHYDLSLSEFRTLLEKLEIVMQNIPRILITEWEEKATEEFNTKLQTIEDEFHKHHIKSQQIKRDNESQLEPILGHPQHRLKFQQLVKDENIRKENYEKKIEETYEKSKHMLECLSLDFLKRLTNCTYSFLKTFEEFPCIDDVIEPGTKPEVKSSLCTLLKNNLKLGEGAVLDEVERISSTPKNQHLGSLKRGKHKWPPLPYIPEDMVEGMPDKCCQTDIIRTKNAVLPQQQTCESRDERFKHFLQSRSNAVKLIESKKDERVETESRWSQHWVESMKKIENLYQ